MEFSGKCLVLYPKKSGRRWALLHSKQVPEYIHQHEMFCHIFVLWTTTRIAARLPTQYAMAFTLTDHSTLYTGHGGKAVVSFDHMPAVGHKKMFLYVVVRHWDGKLSLELGACTPLDKFHIIQHSWFTTKSTIKAELVYYRLADVVTLPLTTRHCFFHCSQVIARLCCWQGKKWKR